MSMRIGSRFLTAGCLGLAAFFAASPVSAAGAGAIGGGFGSSALGGGGVVGRQGGFVGRPPYGRPYRGPGGWQHGGRWHGAWAGRHPGRFGHNARLGRGYGSGNGYGYGGLPYAYGGGGGYPGDAPPASQPIAGIPPSPVLPPAIYVINGKGTATKTLRKSSVRSGPSVTSQPVGGSSGAVVTRVTPDAHRMN